MAVETKYFLNPGYADFWHGCFLPVEIKLVNDVKYVPIRVHINILSERGHFKPGKKESVVLKIQNVCAALMRMHTHLLSPKKPTTIEVLDNAKTSPNAFL